MKRNGRGEEGVHGGRSRMLKQRWVITSWEEDPVVVVKGYYVREQGYDVGEIEDITVAQGGPRSNA